MFGLHRPSRHPQRQQRADALVDAITGGGGNVTAEVVIHIRDGAIVEAAPAAPADRPSEALPRHGLGLGILKKLAALYDGSLETSSSDGIYETSLILHCRPAAVPAGG